MKGDILKSLRNNVKQYIKVDVSNIQKKIMLAKLRFNSKNVTSLKQILLQHGNVWLPKIAKYEKPTPEKSNPHTLVAP